MMDEFSKPSKKGSILAVVCYVFAVALLITAFVSLAACHQNISRQLEQGVPVQGNELAIVNLYLTSCVQYFALAAAMVFCGKAARRVLALKNEAPVRVTPYTKTNNLSAKAGATNVTSNNGYVGDFFGGFYSSSMRVLRKPSISGGMASSDCCTGWEGTA